MGESGESASFSEAAAKKQPFFRKGNPDKAAGARGSGQNGEVGVMKCEVCGNDYDKALEVIVEGGVHHHFDSFECAIHALAPECAQCGCKVIGHGVQAGEEVYCCAHCAEHAGIVGIHDRV